MKGSGVRVWGLGFRVQGLGFRVSGVGFRVSEFRVSGSGFRVQGVGWRACAQACGKVRCVQIDVPESDLALITSRNAVRMCVCVYVCVCVCSVDLEGARRSTRGCTRAPHSDASSCPSAPATSHRHSHFHGQSTRSIATLISIPRGYPRDRFGEKESFFEPSCGHLLPKLTKSFDN